MTFGSRSWQEYLLNTIVSAHTQSVTRAPETWQLYLGYYSRILGWLVQGGGGPHGLSMLLETHVAYLNCLSRALKCVLSSRNKWLTWELQEGKTNTCIQSCHISANPRLGQDFCSLARNIETWWRHQHKKNQDCKTGKVWLNSMRNVIATPNGVPFAHKSKETEITHTM